MKKLIASVLLAVSLLACAPKGPAPTLALAQSQNSGRADVKVWVNTRSGVYHCPGTRWYGSTNQGEYMAQKQAQDRGYRPAYGRVCE